MKIAFLTDLHANREAFEACLEAVDRVGVDQLVFLGDFVGYGADPGWVLDRVMALVREGALAVRGNHDDGVVHGPRPTMTAEAKQAVYWTRDQLAPEQLAFLEALPYSIERDQRLYVHANAFEPEQWAYVASRTEAVHSMAATSARHTFCGHMHEPMLYNLSGTGKAIAFVPTPGVAVPLPAHRQWLAIPGSVGQPRDGNPAACWALFDSTEPTLTFQREPYDIEAAAHKVTAAGLPPHLAQRLRDGH